MFRAALRQKTVLMQGVSWIWALHCGILVTWRSFTCAITSSSVCQPTLLTCRTWFFSTCHPTSCIHCHQSLET